MKSYLSPPSASRLPRRHFSTCLDHELGPIDHTCPRHVQPMKQQPTPPPFNSASEVENPEYTAPPPGTVVRTPSQWPVVVATDLWHIYIYIYLHYHDPPLSPRYSCGIEEYTQIQKSTVPSTRRVYISYPTVGVAICFAPGFILQREHEGGVDVYSR